jgi:hypothetical protein
MGDFAADSSANPACRHGEARRTMLDGVKGEDGSCAMAGFLSNFAVPIALAAVAFVLLLGLLNMMRGGSPNTSQRLMRLRVLLQFAAIVIAMAALWAMAR